MRLPMPSRKKKNHHHRSPPPHPHYNPIIIMPPPLPEQEEEEAAAEEEQQLETINEEEEEPEEEEEEEEGRGGGGGGGDPQQPDLIVPQIKEEEEKEEALTDAQHHLSLLLLQNFHPMSKKAHLDLSPLEPLLRALGLWDFAAIDLCADDLRTDLLAHLISSYDPSLQRSFVHSVPLTVSRYALAKSLSLPLERLRPDPQLLLSDDGSIAAVEEFMANYILLDGGGDASVLPEEATAATAMVKEGRAGEVDWADLMWVLVEKEILEAPRTGRCPHGPHLQRLIQCHWPQLFGREAGSATVPEPESDCLMEVSDSSVDEDEEEIEECETALSLGLGEKDDAVPLPPEEDKGFGQHCLRRCGSVGNERGMEFEDLRKGDEEGREEGLQNFERPTSADLLHGMETAHGSYDHQMNRLEPGNGEFLAAGVDADKDMATGSDPGGSLFFGNNVERQVHSDDIDGNDRHKRMRTDGLWGEQAPPSNFDSFMEQIQCTMGRAKMLYDEKDQACMNTHMEIRYLTELLEQKDQFIQTLEKTRVEEQQKWQQTVCWYESELNLVAELMLGYKKALKQIDRNFTEYRKKFLQGDEPIYRDVPGEGGLVLSVRELERRRLENETGMHRIAEEMVSDFEKSWSGKLDACADCVLVLQKRLMGLHGEIVLLKKEKVCGN